MDYERLDPAGEALVRENVEKLMKFLDDLPRSNDYSHLNMSLNVLTGAFIAIGFKFFSESKQTEQHFIDTLSTSLKINFDANRKD